MTDPWTTSDIVVLSAILKKFGIDQNIADAINIDTINSLSNSAREIVAWLMRMSDTMPLTLVSLGSVSALLISLVLDVKELRKKLTEIKDKHKALEEQLKELQNNIDILTDDISKWMSSNIVDQGKISDIMMRLDILENSIDGAKLEYEILHERAKNLEKEIINRRNLYTVILIISGLIISCITSIHPGFFALSILVFTSAILFVLYLFDNMKSDCTNVIARINAHIVRVKRMKTNINTSRHHVKQHNNNMCSH